MEVYSWENHVFLWAIFHGSKNQRVGQRARWGEDLLASHPTCVQERKEMARYYPPRLHPPTKTLRAVGKIGPQHVIG